MRNRLIPWLSLVVLIPTLFQRPVVGETLEHGKLAAGNSVPKGSSALCPAIPASTSFIPSMTTGWAVRQPNSSSVRLVFSDLPLACSNDPTQELLALGAKNCLSGWTTSFLLPGELLTPGTYRLADFPVAFEEATMYAEPGAGCGNSCDQGGSGGSNIPSSRGPDATLEIFSVSDDCITGRIEGLVSGQIAPPPPDFNGAFHAVSCSP